MSEIENVLGVTQSPIADGLGSYALRMEHVLGPENILSIVMDKTLKNQKFIGNIRFGYFPPITNGWSLNLHLARRIINVSVRDRKLVHYFTPLFIPIRRSDIAKAVTIHDTYYRYYNNKKIAKLTRKFRDFENIISISNQTKHELVDDGFAEDSISVIYHYIPDIFRNTNNDRSLQDGKSIVLTVGDGPHKNNAIISKALKEKYYHIHIGKEKVGDENLTNLSLDTMVSLYNRAHVFVRMSSVEGFGYPVLEALFCGTPVVTTDLPVFREIIGDAGVHAKLEADSIVSSIEYAIENRDYLLGEFARIKKNYTIDTFIKNLYRFYKNT